MIPGHHQHEGLELRMVPFWRAIEMERTFEDPELHYVCARIEECKPMSLLNRLFLGQHVMVWDIIAHQGGDSVGYCVLNFKVRARPNIYVFFFDGNFDVDIAKRATLLLVKTIFAKTQESAIDYYMPADVDPNYYNALLEIGFAAAEVDDIDEEIERAVQIDREAYRIYHESDA